MQQINAATSAAVARYVELGLAREREYDDQLESLRRVRYEFISVLSHELRTPLHVIQLSTQLLRSRYPELASRLGPIERNAALLSTRVDELLGMAELVTGRIKLSWARVDLCLVAWEAVGALRRTAEAKDVQLDVEIMDAPGVVGGDRARLYQCIWQLLSNAVAFAPRAGRVRISLSSREDADRREMEVVVADDGAGILRDAAARVFEPFTARESGGLGLGLAFVRHIVELHGGAIDLVSEGEGAAFHLRVPAFSSRSGEHG